MCCERLVCAACSRPVVEASCGTCRDTRAFAHGRVVPDWLAVAAALLITLAVLLAA